MTNIIVASFGKENEAIEAMHKLSELESYGDISIYGKAMVRTRENGEYEILKSTNPVGWRTLTGMAVGSLLGALGGPVGLAVGMFTGTSIGLISDAGRESFNEYFVKEAENKMAPGTVSIIAEIGEDSDVFVNNALKPFGANIKRSDVYLEFDNYATDQINKIDNDLTKAREDMKKAAGREKEKIQKNISDLKEKRNEIIANARNNAKNLHDQIKGDIKETKSEFLEDRIAHHEEKLYELKEKLSKINA